MTDKDVIARFCSLQAEVAEHLDDWSNAADCFCRDPARGGVARAGTLNYYRNDGVALEWIERVGREAIAREKEARKP